MAAFPTKVFANLDIRLQKNQIRSIALTLYKNQFKLDLRV